MSGPARRAAMAAVLLFVLAAACDEGAGYPPLTVRSAAFGDGETIPLRHTCDGDDISFPLEFDDLPDRTVSFAVIMDEPAAEAGRFTHWLLWGVPAASAFVGEGLPQIESLPSGLVQGTNSGGALGYSGPCPAEEDKAERRYVVRAYALDAFPELAAGAERKALKRAIDGHIVGYGELEGFYKREE
jgi:Raf kinase inhibitor-like YbhB/YbcL family protein